MKKFKAFIDGSNISYIAYYTAKNINKSEPEKVFLKIYSGIVKKLINSFPQHEFIFAFEGKNSLKNRLKLFKEYKQQRDRKNDSSFKECLKLAFEYNKQFNIKTLSVEEMEADDLIYALANIYKDTKEENIIISKDHDFLQIVQEGLVAGVYSHSKKDFIEVPDYDIIQYKALVGDSSDNIPGIKGVGHKAAIRYQFTGIPEEYKKTVEKFKDIISLKRYGEKFNTIQRVKTILPLIK